MMKSTEPAEAIVSVAKSLTTLHWAAVGRRVAPQCNDRRRRTRADWRCLIGVAVSAALSLGIAGAAWAVLPDELKPVTKPEPNTTASSKPAVGSEPKPPVKSRSEAETAQAASPARKAGDVFRDCSDCPEMVVIPAGRFLMGSPNEETGRNDAEGPQHQVTIAAKYALGKHEVSVAEFKRFVQATRYQTEAEKNPDQGIVVWDEEKSESVWSRGRSWSNPGFAQDDRHPVVGVSWKDALAYADWLAKRTGQAYRLPSEAEWEYAARAGTTTARFWGNDPNQACAYANVGDRSLKSASPKWPYTIHDCDDGLAYTAPIGRFTTNRFGLHDMIGNAWEWTQDCWNDSYVGAPTDGSPWLKGDCGRRVVRGGSWYNRPGVARAAFRIGGEPGVRLDGPGFRLARTL